MGASMRPPEFTGGNATGIEIVNAITGASMRPPEFTGGNGIAYVDHRHRPVQLQ